MFIIILGVLFCPLAQYEFALFEEVELKGVFDKVEEPEINWIDWREGDFQKKYEQHFNDYIGFRPSLIRTINQLRFSFYNVINKSTGTVGDNNIIYDTRYINSAMGEDFIGRVEISKKVNDIQFIKNKLEEDGKKILFVLAPNKARYFSEEVPSYFRKIDTTNYEVYLDNFEKYGIDYIDFNSSFLKLKKEFPINLIPFYGTHWSSFGSYFAADSIVKYCNTNYNYNLPRFILDSISVSEKPKSGDYDLGENLNLWRMLKGENYVYPHSHVQNITPSNKKNLLVISDSFFEAMYRSDLVKKIFNMTGYWYYNRDVRVPSKTTRGKKAGDLKSALAKTDLIIILSTEFNFYRLGFGITEELKAYYTGEEPLDAKTIQYMNRIRADKVWYKQIKQSAKKEAVSDYEMLLRNAKYMAGKVTK
jgi:hypothetical protein